MTEEAHPTGKILIIVMLAALLITAVSAEEGTVTRGGTFTVTLFGTPRTAYDVWPVGTSDLTGEPGDQPPVIVPGQTDVLQDPPGGPYLIGSHQISGGGTIRDDVPPDSSTTPSTSYYAEVKTDASGYGVVLFQTSDATATGRQFHIVAQNPADLGEDVPVSLGGIPAPVRTGVMPLPMPTTIGVTLIPAVTTPVMVTSFPTPAPTAVTLITPSPEETPAETPPVQGIPVPLSCCLAGIGISVFLRGTRHLR